MEEEYKVGLMHYRTDGLTGKHSATRHSSISFDVLILKGNGYSLRQNHPDKILPVVGRGYTTCEKAKRSLPTQVQTLKPACIALFFRC